MPGTKCPIYGYLCMNIPGFNFNRHWWLAISAGILTVLALKVIPDPGTFSLVYADDAWPKTDFSRTIVNVDEIIAGGPRRDDIPAIDVPKFVDSSRADQWLNDREPVIVVALKRAARAYPLQILMYHEIVNDRIADIPLTVTFCPLCYTSIVFSRRVDGNVLDFGTTGRLRNSDLVMYDRQTESWWQQFTGEAIAGFYAGQKLEQLPGSIVAYETFKQQFPDGEILSRDTGFSRPYGQNPYRGYDDINDRPFLYRGTIDDRLPPMERVIGLNINGQTKIYPLSIVNDLRVINDVVENEPVAVFSKPGMLSVLDKSVIGESRTIPAAKIYSTTLDGRQLTFGLNNGKIVDLQTGSTWNMFGTAIAGQLIGRSLKSLDLGVHFAFAWLAFRPDTQIYKLPGDSLR